MTIPEKRLAEKIPTMPWGITQGVSKQVLAFCLFLSLCSSSSCAAFRTRYVPDDYSPSQELKCTSDSLYVVGDILAGIALMLAPIAVISQTRDGDLTDTERTVGLSFVAAGGVVMLPAIFIAETEYIQDCRHAMITRRGWLDRDDVNDSNLALDELNESNLDRDEMYESDVAAPEDETAPHPVSDADVSNALEKARGMLNICAQQASIESAELVLDVREGRAKLKSSGNSSDSFRECAAAVVASMRFPKSNKPRGVRAPLRFKSGTKALTEALVPIMAMLKLCATREMLTGTVTLDIVVKGGVAALAGTDRDSVEFRECAAAAMSSIRLDVTEDLTMSFPLSLSPIVEAPAEVPIP